MAKAKKSFLAGLYQARQAAERGVAPSDEEFRGLYPFLWELMVECWLDPEHRVEAGRITISNSAGDWLFRAESPGIKASKSIMAHTFSQGLGQLDKALIDPEVPWSFWLRRKASIREVKQGKNGLAKPDREE
jgi:hypothetical protein